jgi:aldose 1-epimerase
VVAPSGEQYPLEHGDQQAVVVSVGGGLRSYQVAGRDVLDGYPADAMADGARAQTLVPWPNRVRDGAWTWRGEDQQLALTEPEQHNAIHGLVRWQPWSLLDRGPDRVVVGVDLYPQPGYPWSLRVENDYRLGAGGLTVVTTVTNRADRPAPVAVGFHPYLTVGTATVDDAVLHLPADRWLPTGEQQIPIDREKVAGSRYDFTTPRPIGDTEIDYTYTDLHRDPDERFRLRLSNPDDGRETVFWLGPAYRYLEVFTGDALPDKDRRRRGLGVEPMTAPPNALASGQDLVVLEPDAQWTGEWGIEPRRWSR